MILVMHKNKLKMYTDRHTVLVLAGHFEKFIDVSTATN